MPSPRLARLLVVCRRCAAQVYAYRFSLLVATVAIFAAYHYHARPPECPLPVGAVLPRAGNLALTGGSATVRCPYCPRGNEQPLGYFGNATVEVYNENDDEYTLDADFMKNRLHRLYFPRGGWVDFPDCLIHQSEDGIDGTCKDEQGRLWNVAEIRRH